MIGCMHRITTALVISCFVVCGLATLAQEKKAPDKLTFEAKPGKVTFDHAKHVAREKNDCKVCHDKLWPQSKAPLNWKAGMHKPAETSHLSCGTCHHPDGAAFGVTGHCNKCHVKAG